VGPSTHGMSSTSPNERSKLSKPCGRWSCGKRR
jgi:hypothetical protein